MNKANKWQIQVFVNEKWISYFKNKVAKASIPSHIQNVKNKMQIVKNKCRQGFGRMCRRVSKTCFSYTKCAHISNVSK